MGATCDLGNACLYPCSIYPDQERRVHAPRTVHHHVNLVPRAVQMLARHLEFAVDCAVRLRTQSPVNLQDIIPVGLVSVKSVKSFNLLTNQQYLMWSSSMRGTIAVSSSKVLGRCCWLQPEVAYGPIVPQDPMRCCCAGSRNSGGLPMKGWTAKGTTGTSLEFCSL